MSARGRIVVALIASAGCLSCAWGASNPIDAAPSAATPPKSADIPLRVDQAPPDRSLARNPASADTLDAGVAQIGDPAPPSAAVDQPPLSAVDICNEPTPYFQALCIQLAAENQRLLTAALAEAIVRRSSMGRAVVFGPMGEPLIVAGETGAFRRRVDGDLIADLLKDNRALEADSAASVAGETLTDPSLPTPDLLNGLTPSTPPPPSPPSTSPPL